MRKVINRFVCCLIVSCSQAQRARIDALEYDNAMPEANEGSDDEFQADDDEGRWITQLISRFKVKCTCFGDKQALKEVMGCVT